jgi:hypothetical protein
MRTAASAQGHGQRNRAIISRPPIVSMLPLDQRTSKSQRAKSAMKVSGSPISWQASSRALALASQVNTNVDIRRLSKELQRQRPDLHERMMNPGPVAKKRIFRHYRELGLNVPVGAAAVAISGEVFQHLHLFSHRAVLSHYFARTKRPLSLIGGVLSFLRPKETVVLGSLPPEILDMLGPVTCLSQGRRNHKEYEFREAYGEADGVYAVACRFRKGFFVIGLAVEDLSKLDPVTRRGFLGPRDIFSILDNDRYAWFDQFHKEAPLNALDARAT